MRTIVGNRKIALLLTLALLMGCGMGTAHAATYYVATNGSDSNSGTQGSPFLTIQKGIDTANAGDTVEVAAGVYRQKLNINSEDGGTPGAPVTIHGASGAIIDASNNTSLTWTLQSGFNGGLYTAPLGYNSNAVFVNDYAIQELFWGTAKDWGLFIEQPWYWQRLFTYGMKNISGKADYDLWGAIPEGWDGVRGMAMVNTDNNTLYLKCMPGGEGSTPLVIPNQTVKVSDYKSVGVNFNGAHDVILDGFQVKYAFYGIWVGGDSRGCEIKNCVIKPCFNGIRIEGDATSGPSGISVHNNEISIDRMQDVSTKNRADNIWHINKSHLESTGTQDKFAILVKMSRGNHHIYDNWIHDFGVGIGCGVDLDPSLTQLYDANIEVNHNLLENTYQDAIGIGRNGTNHKLHHNVLKNVLQFGRLHDIHWGPSYIYNNIMISGPITHNGVVLYAETLYATHPQPELFFYNNTVTLSPDCDINSEPGAVGGEAWLMNNQKTGGDTYVNCHFYNNLFWTSRWFKNNANLASSNPNYSYLSEPQWDGNNNVYCLLDKKWVSGSLQTTGWLDNTYSRWWNGVQYTATNPVDGPGYARATSHVTPHGTYAKVAQDVNGYWTTSAPGFTDCAGWWSTGGDDLSLTSSSPARNRGANLTSLFGTLPGSPSTDCGALAYGQPMLDVPGTTGGAASTPYITTVSPDAGGSTGGSLVTIMGSSLTGASVSFGGTAATGIAINPAGTHLTCTSPAHSAGAVNVTVTTSLGTSNALTFTYNAGGTQTTLNPTADTLIAAGAPTTNYGTGNNMQIQNNGPGYYVESLVKFDLNSLGGTITNAKLRVYKNGSSSSLVVTASTCSNDSWTETGVNWNNRPTKGSAAATVTATAAGWYEWDVTSYASAEFAGDKVMTIYLSDLTEYRNVWTQWWTKEQAGYAPQLVVTTGTGGSAPTLSSIAPTSGTTAGGTACTLTGTNLTDCSAVSFGGTAGTGIVVDSATQVRCTSPAKSAGAASVTATTSNGTSNGVTFTYTVPAPTLSSISPNSGSTAGGTVSTLTGTNLTDCSAVSYAGTAGTSISVLSSTQVRCTSPAKSAGTYSVTATTPGGTSNGVNFTYTASAPTLSSIAPSSGTTAGGTACTLTGTNLTGCSAVSFGGTAGTSIVVDSATQVRCASPAKSAGTYSVTATTAGGTSNGVNYTYTGGGTSYTNTLFTTHDSMVAATSPASTYGSYDNVQVQKTGGTTDNDSYLKFDLSACQGTTVTSAKLKVYKNGNSTSHAINVFSCSDDSWVESTLCWNNRATKGTSQATATVQNTGWYEWTITSYVNTEFAGNKLVTVIMSEENNLNIWTQWWSKEKSGTTYDPYLVVISQ